MTLKKTDGDGAARAACGRQTGLESIKARPVNAIAGAWPQTKTASGIFIPGAECLPLARAAYVIQLWESIRQ
jgi:hypothetical protein